MSAEQQGPPSFRWIGSPLPRREDARLVRGAGQFVADLQRPQGLHAVFIRSPHAHARIRSVDVTPALGVAGVVGAWTGRDLAAHVRPVPHPFEHPSPGLARFIQAQMHAVPMPVLAVDRVCYQGEAVAVVVATDPYVAEDARDLVTVDYEPLPVLTDPEAALAPGAVPIHPEGNLAFQAQIVVGEARRVLAEAPVVVRQTFRVARNAPMPMETRGILAEPDHRGGLHVISATQMPHQVQEVLSWMLGLPEDRIRVQAPDVGGGFGAKGTVYPEEAAIAWLALRLGRPVSWIGDRLEDLATTTHGRGQVHHAEAAFSRDGVLLAIRDHFFVIGGAYNPQGPLTAVNSSLHLMAPYRVAHREIVVRQAYTNMAPLSPYRGSGRPEAVFVSERLMDLGAQELGMDPADLRLRNLVPGEAMPYDNGLTWRNGQPMIYDVGDFPACFQRALDLAGYADLRRRQAAERGAGGRRLGVGVSFMVDGAAGGAFESASIAVSPRGEVRVVSGGAPHGQGHETTLAQICAEVLGVDLAQVTVAAGDTGLIPFGLGTWGSRGAACAGSAVHDAARKVLERARQAAGYLLEANPGDLECAGGRVQVRGVPDRSVTLAEVARAMHPGHRSSVPPELREGLQATAYWRPPHSTFTYAADVAVVEVDPETGTVRPLDYVSVHDCGRVINPLVVAGQTHGGVVQGLGQALFENAAYDGQGQFLTRTLADYLIPTSADVCTIRMDHLETPTGRNPLGVKGMASGTAMNTPAAIANAVADALGCQNEVTAIPIVPEVLVGKSARR